MQPGILPWYKKSFWSVVLLAAFLLVIPSVLVAQDSDASLYQPFRTGRPNAEIKLEVFIDLQCPQCAHFNVILKETEAEYGSHMETTFQYFPLRIPAHDKAIMAAQMVEAARLQGKGREMMDIVLANQKLWTSNSKARLLLLGYARKLRLNMPRFMQDLQDDRTMRPVLDGVARAERLKIRATPTVFLNGRELEFAKVLDLQTVVGELLK